MRLVLISDTHNQQRAALRLPAVDVLVHAGDFTIRGTEAEVREFGEWLGEQPYEHKVLIAGNDDFLFEREPGRSFPKASMSSSRTARRWVPPTAPSMARMSDAPISPPR